MENFFIYYQNIFYTLAAICFILGLKRLSHPKTAREGNFIAILGMFTAIIITIYRGTLKYNIDLYLIIIGIMIGAAIGAVIAIKIEMTSIPQMVAAFNGFGGAASALIATSEFYKLTPQNFSNGDLTNTTLISIMLSVMIGALTFTGSFIAFGKLQGLISGQPIQFKGQKIFNGILFLILFTSATYSFLFSYPELNYSIVNQSFIIIIIISSLLGILLTIPIGGADMPVVISLLNSYSGVAAAATGFVINNQGLIICGSLVGASGIILTQIMCKGMNRSLANVIFGGVGGEVEGQEGKQQEMNIKSYTTEDIALIFDSAEKIIIVPGYGLAVAQAQHAIREISDYLQKKGKKVFYAIHPVAGRMPGHMNVLLAESNVSYEILKDLDEINNEFETADISLIVGANDVVNPAARHDKSSPIYGMPILDVDKSKTVIINKRSMNPGFAGIMNELFGYDNSIMVFGDAKDMLTKLLSDLKELE